MIRPWSDLPPLLAVLAFVLPVLLLHATASGQSRPDAELTALVTKMEARRGKLAKPDATLLLSGEYAVTMKGVGDGQPIAKGTFREIFQGATAARQTCAMGEMGAMEKGFLEDYAWEVDPMMGSKAHRGAPASVTRRYFAFLRGATPRELYRDIARSGKEVIDGREHAVLRMTPADGKPDTWYVDLETADLARVDIALMAPESATATFGMEDAIDSKLCFSEWKLVEGLRIAGKRTLEMGSAKVAFTVTKVEPGVAIANDAMTPPKAVLAQKDKAVASRPTNAGPHAAFEIQERTAQPVASIRLKCKPSEISATLGTVLPEVMGHLSASGAKIVGAPFSRYHAFGKDEIDLEAGIPVAKPIEEKGRVKNSELPGGKTVTTWHVGPYEKLTAAHQALRDHLGAQRLEARGGPWEVYWTDPGMVPDPAKWRTQIFQVIDP